jgi:hypothetical protein
MTPTLWLSLSLVGCDAFRKAFDTVEGLTESTVVQGAVLGIEVPDDPNLAALLEGTDFAPGTAVTAFVVDASSVADLAEAPVDDATVRVAGDIEEAVLSQGDGLYANDPSTSDLVYVDGDQWTLSVTRGDAAGEVSLQLPAGAAVNIPTQHGAGSPLVVDLSGQGFESAIGVVVDASGTVVWSNVPTDVKALYDAMGSEDVSTLEIPGSAFAANQVYLVGVAAMAHTDADDLTDLNTALSKVRVGKMFLSPVTTVSVP